MEKRAIAITVGSLVTMLLIAFLIWCTVLFWVNKNKQDTSYNDGYNAGIEDKTRLEIEITELKKDKSDLTVQLTEARNTITANNKSIENLTAQKDELQTQVTTLTATNESNTQEITRLSTLKTQNENKINELTAQNATQAETINQHVATIATNDATIAQLQQSNADCEAQIETLKTQLNSANADKSTLQQQITTYEATIEQNRLQIAELQATKSELQSRIDDLNESNTQNSATIASLQSQITSLNEQITQLTNTNNTNIATIAQLNTQISSLTARINELSALNVEQSQKMADLNSQVIKLTNYIQKYEQFLAGVESETQAVATFEYDGALYAIQLVTNGGYASVTTPESTEYVVFGGWMVNNEVVDVATYPITHNTKFVAKVTYKFDVLFVADDNTVSTQIVAKDATPTAVTAPTKTGYRFLGWSKDGVNVVDPTTTPITGTTTYTALYVQQFSVRFLDGSTELKSQTVDKSAKATAPSVESTDHKVFNGWTVNNVLVDVANYPITKDTTFVANFTYKYDVLYKNGDTTVSTQLVVKDAYSTVPSTPTKDGYKFLGWSIDGTNIVSPATYKIIANTTFVAVWVQLHTVSFVRGDSVLDTQVVEHGKTATAPTVASTNYEVFNGWLVGGVATTVAGYAINADTTFVADITYKYDVKFMDGDTVVSTQIVAKNATPSAVTAPTKPGYRFDGWSKDGVNVVDPTATPITGTTTYTAVYVQQFTVTFLDDKDGNIVGTKLVDKDAIIGVLDFDVPTKEHYAFKNWGTLSTGIFPIITAIDSTTYLVTSDVTLVAIWEQIEFSVVFTTEPYSGGERVAQKYVQKNSVLGVLDFDVPTKEHYAFKNWAYLDGLSTKVFDPTTYVVTADVNIFAVWEQVEFVVSFYASNSELISTEVVAKNSNLKSVPTVQVPVNKVFVGWGQKGYDNRYSNEAMSAKSFNSNVVYYAYFANSFDGRFATEDGNHVITVVNGYFGKDPYDSITNSADLIMKCGAFGSECFGTVVEALDNSFGIKNTSTGVYEATLIYDKTSDSWIYTFVNLKTSDSSTCTLSRVKGPYASYILD